MELLECDTKLIDCFLAGATSDGAGVDAFEENREKQEELSR